MHRVWGLITILLSPIFALFGLWVYSGYVADKLGQQRRE